MTSSNSDDITLPENIEALWHEAQRSYSRNHTALHQEFARLLLSEDRKMQVNLANALDREMGFHLICKLNLEFAEAKIAALEADARRLETYFRKNWSWSVEEDGKYRIYDDVDNLLATTDYQDGYRAAIDAALSTQSHDTSETWK